MLFLGKVKAEGAVRSLPNIVDTVVSEFFGTELNREEVSKEKRVMNCGEEQDKEMNSLQGNRTMLFQVQIFVHG